LNAYFLAGGHDVHTCQEDKCLACATAEVFMEFNSGERNEAVSAATLLYNGWQISAVCQPDQQITQLANNVHRTCLGIASKMPTSISSSS
jgi:hypothetical protein